MISKELEATLNFALKEAKTRRHEYVSLEHLLYALLRDKDGKAAIVARRRHRSIEQVAGRVFQRPNGNSASRVGPGTATDFKFSSCASTSGDPCAVRGA